MKVLLYGYDRTVRKVETSLNSKGDEAVVVCGYDKVTEMGNKSGFSLAVVDMTAPHATEACECLKQDWKIPVVVILGFGEEGWSILDEVKVDGYIPRATGQAEMLARLKAAQRRMSRATANTEVGGK
jgi:DNA-binding response OmpR family regulator